jgi:hypothetical protein
MEIKQEFQSGAIYLREPSGRKSRSKYIQSAIALLERHNLQWMEGLNPDSAYCAFRIIMSPRPNTSKHFALFAHEVGHIVAGVHGTYGNGYNSEEQLCDLFALGCFAEFGLKHPQWLIKRILS